MKIQAALAALGKHLDHGRISHTPRKRADRPGDSRVSFLRMFRTITLVRCSTSTPGKRPFSDRSVFNERMAVRRMWKCSSCGEAVDDDLGICWKCRQPRGEVASTEYLDTDDGAQEGSTRGIGFFKWRNQWIIVPLGLLFFVAALVLGCTLFEDLFRAVPGRP